MSDTLRTLLPIVYGPRLPAFFDRPVVHEPRATCSDCAMCDKGAPATELPTGYFDPDIKCCTYHPTLPNYLVGAALADTDPDCAEGRARLRKKLAERIGVTPGWLAAPKKQHILFEAARDQAFGRARSLACPYYVHEGGKCSVWPYRESVCATFFCKHTSGKASHTFWTALKRYMIHVERTLSRYAVKSFVPEVVEPNLPLHRLSLEDLEDRAPRDEAYASWWRGWVGREEEFYKECGARVRDLSPDAFAALVANEDGGALLEDAGVRYDAVTSPRLASHLKLSPDMTVTAAADGVAVTTYSRFDPLFLTQDLYLALQQFTGKEPVPEALAALLREHDVELPEPLLLSMQLFGVMTPVTPTNP